MSDKKSIYKLAANWVINDLQAALKKTKLDISQSPISGIQLGQLVRKIYNGDITNQEAKVVFKELWNLQVKSNDQII